MAGGTVTVPLRLAGGGSRGYTGYRGGNDWRASGVRLPRFTAALEFTAEGWTGGAIPQTASVACFTHDKALAATLASFYWPGAPIEIRSGDDATPGEPTWKIELVGRVASASVDKGVLTLIVSDLSGALAKPALVTNFLGTGDLEGGSDATGRPRRRSWGAVFNVEGRLLDKANSIYEFGDTTLSGAVTGFAAVKDKGREGPLTAVGWQGSAIATLNALRATAAPAGGGVVAPSIACVKWWTTPSGPLTADLNGAHPGSYVPAYLAELVAATYAPGMTVTNTAAAAGWRNVTSGVHVDDTSETVGGVLDRLLAGASLNWTLTGAGQIVIGRWEWTASTATLVSQEVRREAYFPPLLTRRVGYLRNARVHNDGEISAALLTGADVTYADGTTLESLKPAQAGANVTGLNTAAGFAGQGALATLNFAQLGSRVTDAQGNILNNGQVITSLGNSAGFAGQGALATLNAADFATQVGGAQKPANNADVTSANNAAGFAGQGALATLNYAQVGSRITDGGGNILTAAQLITAQGVAAAIAGQAAWATLVGQPTSKLDFLQSNGWMRLGPNNGLVNEAGNAWLTDGGVITSLGTAGGFVGQGALATLNFASLGSRVTDSFGVVLNNSQVITSQGSAASILGQGALATKSTADFTLDVGGATKPKEYAGRILDTRDFDFSPQYYYDLGVGERQEFKNAGFAGTGSSGFGHLLTVTQWPNDGGGPVKQTLVDSLGQIYERASANGSTWGAWGRNFNAAYRPRLGGDILTANGGTLLTDANTITAQGVAAGFTGQGALATLNAADFATRVDGAGKPELFATRGTNLVFNGDAEQGTLAGTIPGYEDAGGMTIGVTGPLEAVKGAAAFYIARNVNGNASAGAAIAWRAVPMLVGREYVLRAIMYASNATPSGVYLRVYEGDAANGGGGAVSGNVSAQTGFRENAAIGIGLSVFEFRFTATKKFASPVVHNWTNGPDRLIIDEIEIVPVTNWSAGVGGDGRPADNATADTVFVPNAPTRASGSGVHARGETGDWSCYAATNRFVRGPCRIRGKLPTAGTFMGFSKYATAQPGATYVQIAGWHRSSDGNWYVYSIGGSGVSIGTSRDFVTFGENTVFECVWNGIDRVEYYADDHYIGFLPLALNVGAGEGLYGAVALVNSTPNRITDLAFLFHADVTARNTAAGFAGQGSLATKNQVGQGDFNVASLSAITSTIGLLRTATSGQRFELDNNGLRGYDANRLRVQLEIT